MKKWFPFLVIFSVLLVHCATDHGKMSQDGELKMEGKFEAPVWEVGDFWGYQLEDKTGWSCRVARLDEALCFLECPGDQYLQGFDRKNLQFKVFIDSG